MTTLQNNPALVAGASRGIGRATAAAPVGELASELASGRFAPRSDSTPTTVYSPGGSAAGRNCARAAT